MWSEGEEKMGERPSSITGSERRGDGQSEGEAESLQDPVIRSTEE